MRSIWTGSLSFGLVNIPIRLYSGTKRERLDFDLLHKKDLSPIRYARVCKAEGKEVPYEEIVKGYEYEKGEYVVLTEEDFERANVRKNKSIEIISFAQQEEIDPNYFEKPYWIEPDKGAARAYALLREALRESGRVGIAQFVLRNREHLCIVRPEGEALALNQMRFASELQEPSSLQLPERAKPDAKELSLALSLIDQFTEPFRPENYKDTYHEELERLIEEKLSGKAPAKMGKAPEPTKVRDLMSLLKASLEQQEAGGKKTSTKSRAKRSRRAS
ncbi:MAG TPA: Ku protein [Oculatellaceae cyanobacterium]|jgi:DNA end-binding protein Ku